MPTPMDTFWVLLDLSMAGESLTSPFFLKLSFSLTSVIALSSGSLPVSLVVVS